MDVFIVWGDPQSRAFWLNADRVVKGKFILLSYTCCKHKNLTTESSVWSMKLQICHHSSKYSGAYSTCKSTKGIFAEPGGRPVSTSNRQECDSWVWWKFTSKKLFKDIHTWFAVCEYVQFNQRFIINVSLLLQYSVIRFHKTTMLIGVFGALHKIFSEVKFSLMHGIHGVV